MSTEPPNLEPHAQCHDLVCNGDRMFPRGEPGHTCSCRSRAERLTAEVARLTAERDQLQRQTFNMNDTVLVKLREAGLAEIERQDEEINRFYPKLNPPLTRRARMEAEGAEHDGWTRWQLWDLMHTLGPVTSMGKDVPFETEIRLAGLSETRGNPAENATCASCETLRGLLEIKDAAVGEAIRRAERAERELETAKKIMVAEALEHYFK